ncbi:expressed unknown protein [Seminavis robusta]|uniref:Uncharacterized protein n=1 Tax=Seminavis robusta TaxID=568900 RepID=A0A9N8HP54_9STRA|nr:expressed unknown protein [Seminavis robusta]|eukprot:Sro1145_g246250.1 n/a (485) ;mRNA; f:28859-30313
MTSPTTSSLSRQHSDEEEATLPLPTRREEEEDKSGSSSKIGWKGMIVLAAVSVGVFIGVSTFTTVGTSSASHEVKFAAAPRNLVCLDEAVDSTKQLHFGLHHLHQSSLEDGRKLRLSSYQAPDVGGGITNNFGVGGNQRDIPASTASPAPSESFAPTVSMSPSFVPSLAPSGATRQAQLSNPPSVSAQPSASPSATPSTSPSASPSASPSTSPSISNAPSAPEGEYGTLYFVAYLSGRPEFGCEEPIPAMSATCDGNGTLAIIEHPDDNHDCNVTDNKLVCGRMIKAHILLRCSTIGMANRQDLVLNVTLPEADLNCDACIDEDCEIIRSDLTGESYNRLFVFTGCDEDFYNIVTDECSGIKRLDLKGNTFCETFTGCRVPAPGGMCSLNLNATDVQATAPLLPEGHRCIYPFGYGSTDAPTTGAPSQAPSLNPSDASRGIFFDFSPFPSTNPSEMPSWAPSVSSAPSQVPSLSSSPSEMPSTQ